ncbi:substrate-binding domain-containing protein, partial [Coprococcus eutactus]
AINACSEFGYRVPDDISVIGFDDMPYSQYLTPELTTVRKPTETMIQKGIKRLLEIIEKPAVVEPVRRI